MYRNESLEKYLKDVAAGTPTPGGGSVAALVGALATALVSMPANFTIGRDEYREYDSQIDKILSECSKTRETLLSLMEEDITAYTDVNKAYGLPKSTDEEKKKRSDTIQKATITAMEVPLRSAMCCLYVLELTRELVDIANPNLISDVGSAGFLAHAAFHCAKLNVEINLARIENVSLVEKVTNELSHAEKKAKTFFHETQEHVREKMLKKK